MRIFGKTLGEYVRFQRGFLIAIVVVGLLRLALSLAGVPNTSVKWVSLTAVALAGTLYYAVRVHTSGFGSYRQLLPLLVIQSAVANAIVIAGIVLSAATGEPNIFSAPEYGGQLPVAFHILGHVIFGTVVGPLIGWLIASIVMFVTKRVAPRGTARPAAA